MELYIIIAIWSGLGVLTSYFIQWNNDTISIVDLLLSVLLGVFIVYHHYLKSRYNIVNYEWFKGVGLGVTAKDETQVDGGILHSRTMVLIVLRIYYLRYEKDENFSVVSNDIL